VEMDGGAPYFNPDLFSNLNHFLLLREDLDVKEEDKDAKYFQYATESIIGRVGTQRQFLYFFSLPPSLEKEFTEKYMAINFVSVFNVENLYVNGKHFQIHDVSPFILDPDKLLELKITTAFPDAYEVVMRGETCKFTINTMSKIKKSFERIKLSEYMDYVIIPLENEELVKKMKRAVQFYPISCLRRITNLNTRKKELFLMREPQRTPLDFLLFKTQPLINCLIESHELKLLEDT